MTETERLSRLCVPTGTVDVILDTDAYNEIDDQFALAYLLANAEKLHTVAVTAAPFFNKRSESPADGMEKSYQEIFKVLKLCGRNDLAPCVYRGATCYLKDEQTPVPSPAADAIVRLARAHQGETPLYVVAIGAITNVASALLAAPDVAEKIVVVWLGGHALDWGDTREFNMRQDVAAARVVFSCGVPLVQLPCCGVVDAFATTAPELRAWLIGKNPLCTYLGENVISYMEARPKSRGRPWSKPIWDVTAVAWLLNEGEKRMRETLVHTPMPTYDGYYAFSDRTPLMRYVTHIHRDALFADLVEKLQKQGETV